MKYWRLCLAIIALYSVVILEGCHGAFIPDPRDSRLPAYTENGNDVSGTLVNGVAWKGEFIPSFDMPAPRPIFFTNYSAKDSTTLTLYGKYIEGTNKEQGLSLTVGIRGLNIGKTEDVMSLDGKTFQIDNVSSSITIEDPWLTLSTQGYLVNGIGSITIKKVKIGGNVVYGRDNGTWYRPVIIAGVFQFDFNSGKIKIDAGRFDFIINDFYIDNQ